MIHDVVNQDKFTVLEEAQKYVRSHYARILVSKKTVMFVSLCLFGELKMT